MQAKLRHDLYAAETPDQTFIIVAKMKLLEDVRNSPYTLINLSKEQ